MRSLARRSRLLGMLLLCSCLWQTADVIAARVEIAVQSADGRSLPGAVITVRALTPGERPVMPVKAVMDQIHQTFVPDLLVIPVGSTIEFPNSDSVSHQIYSFSSARKFQLPLYRGKPYPPVQFDHTGVVTLGCNIHDSMLAYVVVTDASYFGRTDSAGKWSSDIPRGSYRVSVWHPRLRDSLEPEQSLTVANDEGIALSLRLSRALQLAPMENRHHSWDAY